MNLNWDEIKNFTPFDFGLLQWHPQPDLPNVLYIICQKIKELEEKEGKHEEG
jgi:hypothetical protein